MSGKSKSSIGRKKEPEPESESESESGSYSYYSTDEEEDQPKIHNASDILSKLMEDDDEDDVSAPAPAPTKSATGGKKSASATSSTKEATTKSTKEVVAKTAKPKSEPIEVGGSHFVGFIYQVGVRKEELPIKIWHSNNIGADRKSWEAGVPSGLKLHAAIYCKNGDGEKVCAAWHKIHAEKGVPKSPKWYMISKKAIDSFVDSVTRDENYVVVTEGKAKLKAS